MSARFNTPVFTAESNFFRKTTSFFGKLSAGAFVFPPVVPPLLFLLFDVFDPMFLRPQATEFWRKMIFIVVITVISVAERVIYTLTSHAAAPNFDNSERSKGNYTAHFGVLS